MINMVKTGRRIITVLLIIAAIALVIGFIPGGILSALTSGGENERGDPTIESNGLIESIESDESTSQSAGDTTDPTDAADTTEGDPDDPGTTEGKTAPPTDPADPTTDELPEGTTESSENNNLGLPEGFVGPPMMLMSIMGSGDEEPFEKVITDILGKDIDTGDGSNNGTGLYYYDPVAKDWLMFGSEKNEEEPDPEPSEEEAIISLKDILFLRYYFWIDTDDILEMLYNGYLHTRYLIPIPEFILLEAEGYTFPIYVDVDGWDFAIGWAEIDNGKAYITFEGDFDGVPDGRDFWNQPWEYEFISIDRAYVELPSKINPDYVDDDGKINIPGWNLLLNLKIAERQPTPHKIDKRITKSYDPDNLIFDWEITYTPGSITDEKDYPLFITDTFDNSKQVLIPGSIVVKHGGVDITNAIITKPVEGIDENEEPVTVDEYDHDALSFIPNESGNSIISYEITEYDDTRTPITITYQTRMADEELPTETENLEYAYEYVHYNGKWSKWDSELINSVTLLNEKGQVTFNTTIETETEEGPSVDEVPVKTVTAEVRVKYQDKVMSWKRGAQATKKSGSDDPPERVINWTVNIHTRGRVIDELVITDPTPNYLTLDPSTIKIRSNDDPATAYLTEGDDYEIIVVNEKIFEILIYRPTDGQGEPSNYAVKGYTLTYTTIMDDYDFEGNELDQDEIDALLRARSYTNVADIDFDWYEYKDDGTVSDTATPASRDATYSLGGDTSVVHKSGDYSRKTGRITWTVTVNRYQVDVVNGIITDDLTARGQTYVPGSFKPEDNPLIKLINVLPDEGGEPNKILKIEVGAIGKKTYSFSFETTIDDPAVFAGNYDYDDDGILLGDYYHNYATFSGQVQRSSGPVTVNHTAYGRVWVTSHMLDKTGVKYDYNAGVAKWRVTINHNEMDLTNVVLTDKFSVGQTYVDKSVVVTPDVPFVALYNETTGTLTITIPSVNAQTVITYNTTVNPNEIDDFLTMSKVYVKNSVTLQHDAYYTPGLNKEAQIPVTNKAVYKDGIFNYTEKKAAYSVDINANAMMFDGVVATDTIPLGLQLDITSVKLWKATINEDGEFSKDTIKYKYDDDSEDFVVYDDDTGLPSVPEISPVKFTLDYVDSPTKKQMIMDVKIPDGTDRYILEYDCFITDVKQRSFENNIVLSANGKKFEKEPGQSKDDIEVGSSGTGISSMRVQLNVLKVDEDRPGLPLRGVDFNLYQKIGQEAIQIMDATTDENGRMSFYPLARNSTYILEEVDWIKGYEESFKAKPGSFKSTDIDVSTVWVKIEEINGDRTITEISATPTSGSKQCLQIKVVKEGGGATDLTVMNKPILGGIQFTKTTDRADKDTFLPVSGYKSVNEGDPVFVTGDDRAKFRITDMTKILAGYPPFTMEAYADKDGFVTFKSEVDLPLFGVYKVEEIETPQYHTPAKPFYVMVAEDGNTYYMGAEPALKIDKNNIDSEIKKLYIKDGNNKDILDPALLFGIEYEYEVEDDTTITMYGWNEIDEELETVFNTVKNVYYRPDFIITKVDSNGNKIDDVKFELCKITKTVVEEEEIIVETPVDTQITSNGGVATFEDLYGGDSYVIKELRTAANGSYYVAGEYKVDTVNQAKDYEYRWINYEHDASLEITKVDSERTGVLLDGAVFGLYSEDPDEYEGDLADILVATSDPTGNKVKGKVTFTGLKLNQPEPEPTTLDKTTINPYEPVLTATDYWLVEITAPDGYILDPTPVKVTLDPDVAKNYTENNGKNPRTYTYKATKKYLIDSVEVTKEYLTNEPTKHTNVTLSFTKYSNQDKDDPYVLGTSTSNYKQLAGVQFTMTDLTTGSDLVRTATSDEFGVVKFEDIPFGIYKIHEVATPQYHKTLADFYVEFDKDGKCIRFGATSYTGGVLAGGISPTLPTDFVVINEIYNPNLTITKTKADGTTAIGGVTFELCKANGDSFVPAITATTGGRPVNAITGVEEGTAVAGKATFVGLLGGDTYTVKELGIWNVTKSIYEMTGYYMTGTYTVGPISSQSTITYTWKNYEYDASIEVTKVDAMEMREGVKVVGAKFNLYSSDPTTAINGLYDEPPKNFEDILASIDTTLVDTKITDSNGVAKFSGLKLDQTLPATAHTTSTPNLEPTLTSTTYWLVEIEAAPGYIANPTPVPVTLMTRTGKVEKQIKNTPVTITTMSFTKYTDKEGLDTPAVLPGAKFKIIDKTKGSEYVQEIESDENGIVTFEVVPFGIYEVVETVTPQYHNTITPFYIEIDIDGKCIRFGATSYTAGVLAGGDYNSAGLSGPFSVTNLIKRTTLTITKQNDLGEKMNTIEFELYRVTYPLGVETETKIGASQVTNTSGVVQFTGLMGGEKYHVKEVGTPSGYYTTGVYEIATVDPTTAYTYTWINYRHAASITITKYDSLRYRDATHAGLKVEGAVFELYDNAACTGTPVGTATTNANGIAKFENLPLTQPLPATTTNEEPILTSKSYWIKEFTPAVGYKLSTTITPVTLDTTRTQGYTLDIKNDPVTADFSFTKYTDRDDDIELKTILAGAKFTLTDTNPDSPFTQERISDTFGVVSFTGIPHGSYVVTEDTYANHEALSFNVVIGVNGTNGIITQFDKATNPTGLAGPFEIKNITKKTTLTITKQNNGGTLSVENIWFDLYRVVAGVETKVADQQTNTLGVAVFTGLRSGEKYVAKERNTPLTGYYTAGEYTIDVVNPATAYTHTWTNYAHAASIEVTKVDSERTGVKLAGAVFELYRSDLAGNKTGAAIATSEETGTDGIVTFTGLELDQDTSAAKLSTNSEPVLKDTIYWLVEKTTPTGYTTSAPISVTLSGGTGATTRTQVAEKTVTNVPTKHGSTNLTFTKYSNKSEAYTLGKAIITTGVQFRMTDQTTGSNIVKYATSGVDGVVTFTDIPFGTYKIEEVSAPEYHKLFPVFYVTFDEDGKCTWFNGKNNPSGSDFDIVNEIFDPSIIITKKDDKGNLLENIQFELCKANGESFVPAITATTGGRPVNAITGLEEGTAVAGKATFTGLLGGDSYVVKEWRTAENSSYYVSGEYKVGPINKQTDYTYEWINYKYDASIEVTKVDAMRTGVKVVGATFGLYSDASCTAQVATAVTGTGGIAKFEGLKLTQDTGAANLSTNAEPTLITTDYWIKEVGPVVDGYILNTNSYKVTLTGGSTTAIRTQKATPTIENDPVTGDIEFTKYTDRDAGATLADAVFKITDQTTGSNYKYGVDGTATSGADGVVKFEDVPFGRYKIEEITTPTYHNAVVDFYVTISTAGKIVEFAELGSATGTTELTGPFSVTNTIKTTSLTITKEDDLGAAMKDIEFDLYRVTYPLGVETETQIGLTATTDASGVVQFTGLMGGETYRVKEVTNPATGYYTTGVYELTITNPDIVGGYTHTWINYRHAASIEVTKGDSKRPGVLVSGAKFKLYSSDPTGLSGGDLDAIQVGDEQTTNGNGKVIFTGLELTQGTATTTNAEPSLSSTTYWLVETEPAEGYVVKNNGVLIGPIPVTLTTRTQSAKETVNNDPLTVPMTFIKYTDREGLVTPATLAGAKFRITDQTAHSEFYLEATSTGTVDFTGVPHGRYLVEEIVIPDYHTKIDDFYVTISETGKFTEFGDQKDTNGLEGPFSVTNYIKRTSLTIKKQNDLNAAMKDIWFDLYRVVEGIPTKVDEQQTNALGIVEFTGLMGGEKYIARERTNPASGGYYTTGEYTINVVNPATAYNEIWTNYRHAASIEVTKMDAKYSTTVPVAGAKFKLYRDDGTGEAPNMGAQVGSEQTTDRDGIITFTGLELTQNTATLTTDAEPTLISTIYWLIETGKATGYELDSTLIKVTLNPSGKTTPRTYTYPQTVTNEPEYVTITYAPLTFGNDWTSQSPDKGGGVSRITEMITVVSEDAAGSTATVAPGYDFVGWFVEGTDYTKGANIIEPNAAFTPAKDTNGLNVAATYVAVFKEKANVPITYKAITVETVDENWVVIDDENNIGGRVSRASESLAPATGNALGSLAMANSGYHFVGWYKASDTDFETKLTAIIGEDGTFKPEKSGGLNVSGNYIAVFEENANVTITYAAGTGGSVSPVGPEIVAPATGTPSGSTATAAAGYTFSHWTTTLTTDATILTDEDETGTIAPLKNDGVYQNVTYTAIFTENANVTITYKSITVEIDTDDEWKVISNDDGSGSSSGGTVSPTSERVKPATGVADGSTAVTKDGYEFIGWTTTLTTDDTTLTGATIKPLKNGETDQKIYQTVTYTAVFKEKPPVPITYTIVTVDSNGTTKQTPNDNGGAISSEGENLPPATGEAEGSKVTTTNAGYTFMGWYDAEDTNFENPLTTISEDGTFKPAKDDDGLNVAGDYVALFKENPNVTINYTVVTVDEDWGLISKVGGGVLPTSETLAPATGTALGSTATENPGYVFMGWYVLREDNNYKFATPLTLNAEEKNDVMFVPAKEGGLNIARTYVAVFMEDDSVQIVFKTKTFSSDGDEQDEVTLKDVKVAPAGESPSSTATAKPGYTFKGWFKSGDDYEEDDAQEKDSTFKPDKDTDTGLNVAGTYIAVFVEDPDVTIYYKAITVDDDWEKVADGGSVLPTSETLAPATGTALGSTATASKGYELIGWYVEDEDDDYENGELANNTAASPKFTPAKDDDDLNVPGTYVAVFREKAKVKITYTAGTGGSVSDDEEYVAPFTGTALGSTATVSKGYKFVGWFKVGVDYTDEENILGTTLKFDPPKSGDLNVAGDYIAIFEIDPAQIYTINYISNGNGTVNDKVSDSESHQVLYKEANAGSTPKPAAGYEFKNWTSDAAGLDEVSTDANYVPTVREDATFYANFVEKANVTITYVAETGGSVSDGSESIKPATGGDAKGSTVTVKPGYTFTGWTTSLTTDATVLTGITVSPEKNGGIYQTVTYTAHFTQNDNVTINYVAETGGTVNLASESLAPATGIAQGSTATAKAGYTFTGWTLEEDGDYESGANKVSPAKADDNASLIWTNRTYTAHFTQNPNVTINYSAIGGTVSETGESLPPATGTALGSTAKENTGYVFVGWFKLGDDYTDDTKIISDELTYIPPKVGELNVAGSYVAVFVESDEIMITYAPLTFGSDGLKQTPDSQGGSVTAPGYQKLAPATGTALGSTAAAKPGYKFIGWFAEGDIDFEHPLTIEENPVFIPEKVGVLNVAAKYIAVFVEDPDVTITYTPVTVDKNWTKQTQDNKGGDVSVKTEDVAPSTGEPDSEATVKKGYTFIGWFKKGSDYKNDTPLSTDLEFVPPVDGDGLNESAEYVAVFQENPDATITYTTTDGGEVSKDGEKVPPVTGTAEGSTAAEKPGYTFKGWFRVGDDYERDVPVSTDLKFVPPVGEDGLNEDGNYIAVFTKNPEPPAPPVAPKPGVPGVVLTTTGTTETETEPDGTTEPTDGIEPTIDEPTTVGETDGESTTERRDNDTTESIVLTTEPAIDEPTNPDQTGERQTTEAAGTSGDQGTEPKSDEILILPEGVELIDNVNVDELANRSDFVLLENGWYAVKLGEKLWQIFDENGVVLGVLILPDEILDIEDCEIEYIESMMVLMKNVMTFAEAQAAGLNVNDGLRDNPTTGDSSIIFVLLALTGLCAAAAIVLNKKSKLF